MQAYTQQQSLKHKNLVVSDAGLLISLDRPYIGASPDGIVSCDCCGKGVVDVKCPLCVKDGLPDASPPGFCMKKDEWKL